MVSRGGIVVGAGGSLFCRVCLERPAAALIVAAICKPPVSSGEIANPLKSAAAAAKRLVLTVLSIGRDAKITNPVIIPVAIDVVNVTIWPFSVEDRPSNTMGHIVRIPDTAPKMAAPIVGNKRGPSRISGVPDCTRRGL